MAAELSLVEFRLHSALLLSKLESLEMLPLPLAVLECSWR